jgi:hypothetical protein
MNDLRKAAEMALKYFEDAHGLEDAEVAIKEALRQALDLQTAIEKGTEAWADVPNASEWVEELRGYDTPEVTPEVPCKTHPDAPHGFDRNASHNADRYVCECESWEPVDKVDMSEKRVPKTDKSIHEPVGWVKIDEVRQYFDSVNCGTIYKTAGEGRVPLYSAPYTKLDTTAGVLHKEWVGLTKEDFYKKDDETVFVLGMKFAEARLKEKNT